MGWGRGKGTFLVTGTSMDINDFTTFFREVSGDVGPALGTEADVVGPRCLRPSQVDAADVTVAAQRLQLSSWRQPSGQTGRIEIPNSDTHGISHD